MCDMKSTVYMFSIVKYVFWSGPACVVENKSISQAGKSIGRIVIKDYGIWGDNIIWGREATWC